MTKSQFLDVLMNPDNYIGVQVVMYNGFPQMFTAKIFYCTPDKIYYTYKDFFGSDRYGVINNENYLLAQFKYCSKREKVL